MQNQNQKINKHIINSNDNQTIPVISVIVTFHNQEKFVRQTLNAILRQTIEVPYEIVICDDGSTDFTRQYVLEEYGEYVRYYKNQFGHKSKNRNFGFGKSRGQYVAFWDGDDLMFPEYLSALYQALQENPESSVAYARFEYPHYGLDKSMLPACNVFEWSESWVKFRILVNTHSLIKRELAATAVWDENMEVAEDWDFNLQLSLNGGKGVHVRRTLWEYCVHKSSTTGRGELDKQLPRSYEIIKRRYGLPQHRVPFTFVSMFSREYPVNRYFENIAQIDMPRSDMHWIVFIDSNDEALIKQIKDKTAEQQEQFASVRIFVTQQEPVHSADFEKRVMRIARNMNVLITNIDQSHGGSDYIFMLEDDTFVEPDAFNKLWRHFEDNPELAFVQGVEMGRWNDPRLGAGTMDFLDQDIIKKCYPLPKTTGVEKISIGGWYCWIGRVGALKNIKMRCLPPIWTGPDEFMIYDLTRNGWECLMDWEVPCQHMNTDGTVLLPEMATGYQVTFTKQPDGYHSKVVEFSKARAV